MLTKQAIPINFWEGLKILPASFFYNMPNLRITNTKYDAQKSCRCSPGMSLSNFKNIQNGKPMASMSFSINSTSAALANHVLHVLKWCSSKKMCGANALGIVTLVANTFSGRNVALCDGIRKSMRFKRFSALMKSAISVGKTRSSPNPTSISLFYLNPKICLSIGRHHFRSCTT